jgi:hypothetical protein
MLSMGACFVRWRMPQRHLAIDYFVVHRRLRLGWPVELALKTPVAPLRGRHIFTSEEAARIKLSGVRTAVVRSRMRAGWSFEEAVGAVHRPPRTGHLLTITQRAEIKRLDLAYEVITDRARKLGISIDAAIAMGRLRARRSDCKRAAP